MSHDRQLATRYIVAGGHRWNSASQTRWRFLTRWPHKRVALRCASMEVGGGLEGGEMGNVHILDMTCRTVPVLFTHVRLNRHGMRIPGVIMGSKTSPTCPALFSRLEASSATGRTASGGHVESHETRRLGEIDGEPTHSGDRALPPAAQNEPPVNPTSGLAVRCGAAPEWGGLSQRPCAPLTWSGEVMPALSNSSGPQKDRSPRLLRIVLPGPQVLQASARHRTSQPAPSAAYGYDGVSTLHMLHAGTSRGAARDVDAMFRQP